MIIHYSNITAQRKTCVIKVVIGRKVLGWWK